MEPAQTLQIISKAWGKQSGYCFFPYIDGNAPDKKARIMSYHEGPVFRWPRDKAKIIEHLESHTGDDVYWCPSLFEYPRRKMELAMDEHALWADLDEVDPREIQDYPPTIAWETSPGRYQALWVLNAGDIQGASWPGKENQRMTYYLGADQAGWDTTQLLRLPGWTNHKPEYRKNGHKDGVPGKLLWKNGRRYLADDFADLPEIESLAGYVDDVVENEIEHIDRHEVWGRVRLRVSKRVRDFVGARSTSGNRSEILWEIERELADAGCSVVEIVAVVQATVWNKFSGRSDELRRLTIEAAKAISFRSADVKEKVLEELEEKPAPVNLFELIKNLKPPRWLIRGILTEGAVGFIAGQPKLFKSWVGLDMALSVASGQHFLGHFTIQNPGPVLYIQEEDSAPLIKQRVGKVWPGKLVDKITMEDGVMIWNPPTEFEGFPDIDAYIGNSLVLSDEGWQEWLDETLAAKPGGYRLLVLDPLMMMAGDVEENRAQEMTTKVYKPLKTLARKHGTAIQLVHHMKKGDPKLGGGVRGGQMLLGSVANHAWAEDSLYFTYGKNGTITCEQESKNAPVTGFTISGIRNKIWQPVITVKNGEEDTTIQFNGEIKRTTNKPTHFSRTLQALYSLGPGSHFVKQVAEITGMTIPNTYRSLNKEVLRGQVTKDGTKYALSEEYIT